MLASGITSSNKPSFITYSDRLKIKQEQSFATGSKLGQLYALVSL